MLEDEREKIDFEEIASVPCFHVALKEAVRHGALTKVEMGLDGENVRRLLNRIAVTLITI